MKKLLLSLSVLCCSVAFAEIQVDTKLMHNNRVFAQDSTIINEAFINRAECSNANESLQCWQFAYEDGYVLCKMINYNEKEQTATFDVSIFKTVANQQDEIICNPALVASFGDEARVELSTEIINANGESTINKMSITMMIRKI